MSRKYISFVRYHHIFPRSKELWLDTPDIQDGGSLSKPDRPDRPGVLEVLPTS